MKDELEQLEDKMELENTIANTIKDKKKALMLMEEYDKTGDMEQAMLNVEERMRWGDE